MTNIPCSTLEKMLRRNGIEDAQSYLEERNLDTPVQFANVSLVPMTGSVHLMKRRTSTRDDIERRWKELQHV